MTQVFDCPAWPNCGCPDGAVRHDCPRLERDRRAPRPEDRIAAHEAFVARSRSVRLLAFCGGLAAIGATAIAVACLATRQALPAEPVTEVAVLVDSSSSVTDERLMAMRQMVFDAIADAGLARRAGDQGTGAIRLVIAEYADAGELMVHADAAIATSADIEGVRDTLFAAGRPVDGGTATLRAMVDLAGFLEATGTDGAQRTIILLTDGLPDDRLEMQAQWDAWRKEPAKVSAIALWTDTLGAKGASPSRVLDDAMTANVTGGEKAFSAELSDESMVRALRTAATINAF
jgi:hypothetical protein